MVCAFTNGKYTRNSRKVAMSMRGCHGTNFRTITCNVTRTNVAPGNDVRERSTRKRAAVLPMHFGMNMLPVR
jgi:hypothetical protein